MEFPAQIEQGPIQAQRITTSEPAVSSGMQPSERFGAHLGRLLKSKLQKDDLPSPDRPKENESKPVQAQEGEATEGRLLFDQMCIASVSKGITGADAPDTSPREEKDGAAGQAVASENPVPVAPDGKHIMISSGPQSDDSQSLSLNLPGGGQSAPVSTGLKETEQTVAEAAVEGTISEKNGDHSVSASGQMESAVIPEFAAAGAIISGEEKKAFSEESSEGEHSHTLKIPEAISKAGHSGGPAKSGEEDSAEHDSLSNIMKGDSVLKAGSDERKLKPSGKAEESYAKSPSQSSLTEPSGKKPDQPALPGEAANIPANEDGTHTGNGRPEAHTDGKIAFGAPEEMTAETKEAKETGGMKNEHPQDTPKTGETVTLNEGLNNGMSSPRAVHQKSEVAQVTQTIREPFVITKKDDNSIEVTLRPEGMGKLQIHLSLNGETVHAKVAASETVGRDFIDRNIQNIMNTLAEEGINIGSFSVHLRDRRDETASDDRDVKPYRISGKDSTTAAVSSGNTLVNIFV